MVYTYHSKASGDRLRITRCDEGHVQLMITSGIGSVTVPVCIDGPDIAEVIGQMWDWAPEDVRRPSISAEQREATETVAALCARGYNAHVRVHGPDTSHAGDPVETRGGTGLMITRGGKDFSVHVTPAHPAAPWGPR